MEIKKIKAESERGKPKLSPEDTKLLEVKYPFNLSFYEDLPTESISLKSFEDYAVARLKLLRTIERVNLTSAAKYSEEWRASLDAELKKADQDLHQFLILGTHPIPKKNDNEKKEDILLARKFDHLSHYIFRLAFCRTDELRKALIAMEVDYFRYKFISASNHNEFIERNLQLTKLDKKRVENMKVELKEGTFTSSKHSVDTMDYYEVSFTKVPDLVRSRNVYLKGGNAYVPHSEIISLIAAKFRKELSLRLAQTTKMMPEVLDDERLSQILSDFDKRYTGTSYTKKESSSVVTAEMLPELSKKSFPLCMKSLYDVVEKEHHAKHWGRLQLGLFFKAVGVSLEEAIIYWRASFVKKAGMDGTRFDKQYLYNIRHMYGKEGKRADYTPYSCMKIIMGNVGPGEHHGCPFRHSDSTPLRTKLAAANIPSDGIKEIMGLVETHHYQIACQKYFEWTHNKATVEGGIQHPNQYFEESQNVSFGILRKAKASVKSIRSSVYEKPRNTFPVNNDDWNLDSIMDDDEDDDLVASMDQTLAEEASHTE